MLQTSRLPEVVHEHLLTDQVDDDVCEKMP